MDASPQSRVAARPLLATNAFDAAGRSAFDFTTDVIAVTALGASAFQIGLLNAAGMIAFLLLAAPVGVLVDRAESRTVLGIGAAVRAGIAVVLAILALTGALSFWLLLAGVLVFGVFGLVTETGQVACVPRLGRDGIVKTMSALQGWDNAIGIVAPSLAALLLAHLAGGWVLMGAAALLTGALIAARRIRTAPLEPGAVDGGRQGFSAFVAELKAGVAPFRENKTLRRLTASTATLNAALAVVSAVEMVFFLRVLGLPVTTVGLSTSLGAVGGVLGATLSTPIVERFGLARVAVGSSIVLCAATAFLLAMLLPIPAVALTGLLFAQTFLWGIAQVAKNIAVHSWFAEVIPTDLLGRASGLQRTVTMGVVPVASLLGGLIGRWSIPWALATGLLLVIASTALVTRIIAPRDDATPLLQS